jgi:HD domain
MHMNALAKALAQRDDLRPLPDRAARLLADLNAPPRLAAHLRVVHQAAWELTDGMPQRFPNLIYDRDAVLFGAATHDIGKTIHVGELSGPGAAHERAGYELLLQHGVDKNLARFARTHAAWTDPECQLEDLLVSLADKIWKAKRVEDLEQLVLDHVLAAHGGTPWHAFMALDDLLQHIAVKADQRMAFQAAFPI